MTKLLHKRVRIFGRSVPLALVMLAITATAAFAAFLVVAQVTGTADAVSSPPVSYPAGTTWECVLVGQGTVIDCTTTGHDLSFQVDKIDDDSVLTATRSVNNPSNNSIIGVEAVFNMGGFPVQGVMLSDPLILELITQDVVLEYRFAGLNPSQGIGPFTTDVIYSNQ